MGDVAKYKKSQFTDDAENIRSVNSSDKGEKTSMVIQGRIARQSTLSAWRESHFILHTRSLRSLVFLIQQLFATSGIHLERKHPIALGAHELTPDLRGLRL
jgi:hypothetical protein